MTIRRRILSAAILFTVTGTASPALAQNAVYRMRAGDTLRFRDNTRMDGVSHEAAGDAALTLHRDAKLAFAFNGGESAQAWFDSLVVDASGPLGGQKPNADEMLRVPFVLHIEPDGRTQTLKRPSFPRSMRLIAELPPAFDDFFPRLPRNGGPLKIGQTWVDTLTSVSSDSGGRHMLMRRISRNRAERDSTVNGKKVMVISSHTDIKIESAAPMASQPYVANLVLTGDESGIALISLAEGRLIARDRTGQMKGAVTYKGGDAPWVVNQSYKYHRSVVAVDEKPRVVTRILP